MAREVIVVYHNHLDPEWARCYDRPLMRNSVMIRSYADVWDWIIDRWLGMADDGFQYVEGQYLVWRTYLNRHPESAEAIKRLIAERKLEILLQGELTPETNYSPAEGLARNYLLAAKFYDEYCGRDYAGTKIAWVWDAFGNSANMPQILKLAGAEAVGGTRYRPCPDHFWVGIDGTALPCLDKRTNFNDFRRDGGASYYGLSRHAHCPSCGGYGCGKCEGRGMVSEHPFRLDLAEQLLEQAAAGGERKAYVLIGGEETLPDRCILDAMASMNQKYGGEVCFRFGDLAEYWSDHRAQYEAERELFTRPTVDLNPVHQGCYVTRIENKQRTRAVCYALVRAEAALAWEAWRRGSPEKPAPDLERAWRNILLNMHHDSISGAHIDAGQAELMEYLDESEAIAHRHAHRARPLPANRISAPDNAAAGVREARLGKLLVRYDLKGILSIEKQGQDLFGRFRYENMTFTGNHSDEVRIGELMLQCEWGDNHNAYYLGDGVLLGKYNYSVYQGENCIWWRGRHEANDPSVKELSWEVRAQPSEDGERLDFFTIVNWDTQSKRLRAVFPVNDQSQESVWEIPYGFIRRSFNPDEQTPSSLEFSVLATRSIGEYPALHWVRHDMDEKRGVAILNRGIPSAKWIPGCFELSLLRSPQMTGDTVLPSVDEIWDVDGTRDTGRHVFEYALWPYVDGLPMGDLTRAGYAYNDASPEVPFDVRGDVVITAFKLAEDGDGYVLRVQEAGGGNGELELAFDEERSVRPADLMERPLGEPARAKRHRIPLHKHQILTLKIR